MNDKNSPAINLDDLDIEALFVLSDSIWDEPEICFTETKTSRKQQDFLISNGFSIEDTDCGVPNAFVAKYGQGAPVIAFLTEMDALRGLGQKADSTVPSPVGNENIGHGCGHNLLGTGSIAAAILYKEALKRSELSGTILVIGCPAEENGSGKSIMARKGIFDGIDVALTWHPSIFNLVCTGSNQSYIQASYAFTGIASHAAVSPEHGRSALEALELMNDGLSKLRNHLNSSQNIHYAILDAGGFEPAMIQAYAKETCLIRAESPSVCERLYQWVNKVAQGAAMMTETSVETRFQESAASLIPVLPLENVLRKAFHKAKLPEYTKEELSYFREFSSLTQAEVSLASLPPNLPDTITLLDNIRNSPICDYFIETTHSTETFPGSSDVGDVSQICPTGVINTACFSYGTYPHSWMWTAQGKSPGAHKGMLYAAEVLANAALMLNEDKELLMDIHNEWALIKKSMS